jgi:hypothetical protein
MLYVAVGEDRGEGGYEKIKVYQNDKRSSKNLSKQAWKARKFRTKREGLLNDNDSSNKEMPPAYFPPSGRFIFTYQPDNTNLNGSSLLNESNNESETVYVITSPNSCDIIMSPDSNDMHDTEFSTSLEGVSTPTINHVQDSIEKEGFLPLPRILIAILRIRMGYLPRSQCKMMILQARKGLLPLPPTISIMIQSQLQI